MKIIIDGMNMVYRMHYTHPTYTVNNKFVGAIYGMCILIRDLFLRFSSVPEVCWEGSSQQRRSLYPEYKAGRTPNPVVFEQANDIKELYSLLGMKQSYCQQLECDDVISYWIRYYTFNGDQVVILSNDQDFFQLVSPNVFIYDLKSGSFLNADYVYNKIGVFPIKVAFYRSLTGDSGDSIKGIKYFKHAIARSLCSKFSDPADMYDHSEEIQDDKVREKILSSKDIVLRNYQLIKLDRDLTPCEIERKPDIDKVKSLFQTYEFHGFLSNFSEWEKIHQSCKT